MPGEIRHDEAPSRRATNKSEDQRILANAARACDVFERHLTIPLNGRPRAPFRTGPRTNCKRAHGAATMIHGPFQRFVRPH